MPHQDPLPLRVLVLLASLLRPGLCDFYNQRCDCDSIDARQFAGDNLDFKGAAISNAQLVDPSFANALSHLNVESLGITSEADEGVGDGLRAAAIDGSGGLTSLPRIRFERDGDGDGDGDGAAGAGYLKLDALASFSPGGIEVRSDLDLTSHTLRNFQAEPGTALRQLDIRDSTLQNVRIGNATVTELVMGDVEMSTATLRGMRGSEGAFVGVGENGELLPQDGLLLDRDQDVLLIGKDIQVDGSVDMRGNAIENTHFASGRIAGEIDLDIKSAAVESIRIQSASNGVGERLALLDGEGSILPTSIELSEEGWLRNMKVDGTMNFRGVPHLVQSTGQPAMSQGRILNAIIDGGSLERVESIEVQGGATVGGTLAVQEDAFIHGGLTVTGTVLGSGPYVDMSDARLKTNITVIGDGRVLDALSSLRGVSYELIDQDNHGEQLGFIAQEVEEIFPQLVATNADGYKGVQYSRFVPLLVEALKEVRSENVRIRDMISSLEHRISLEESSIIH